MGSAALNKHSDEKEELLKPIEFVAISLSHWSLTLGWIWGTGALPPLRLIALNPQTRSSLAPQSDGTLRSGSQLAFRRRGNCHGALLRHLAEEPSKLASSF